MQAHLTPLSGRASLHSFESITSSRTKPLTENENALEEVHLPNSALIFARQRTQDAARGYFLSTKAMLGKFTPSLAGRRISKGVGMGRVSGLTAKIAKKEYKSFIKWLEEERRIEELIKYLSKMQANFQALYLFLVHKNELQKSKMAKQEIKTRALPKQRSSPPVS